MKKTGSYEALLTLAEHYESKLRKPSRDAAGNLFACAAAKAPNPFQRAEAHHRAGINYQRAGQAIKAKHQFNTALAIAVEKRWETLADRIRRDMMMILLDEGDLDAAQGLINEAISGQTHRKERVEVAASISFRGRVLAAQGQLPEALKDYEQADRLLRNELAKRTSFQETVFNYRLDNIVWWLKSLPVGPRRFKLAQEGIRLADEIGNNSRAAECALLAMPLGPLVYRLFNR